MGKIIKFPVPIENIWGGAYMGYKDKVEQVFVAGQLLFDEFVALYSMSKEESGFHSVIIESESYKEFLNLLGSQEEIMASTTSLTEEEQDKQYKDIKTIILNFYQDVGRGATEHLKKDSISMEFVCKFYLSYFMGAGFEDFEIENVGDEQLSFYWNEFRSALYLLIKLGIATEEEREWYNMSFTDHLQDVCFNKYRIASEFKERYIPIKEKYFDFLMCTK